MASPKFFTQWRPSRGREDGLFLYVCAFWRVVGDDGRSRQAGCSYSVEKHGLQGATRLARDAAAQAVRVTADVDEILSTLTW